MAVSVHRTEISTPDEPAETAPLEDGQTARSKKWTSWLSVFPRSKYHNIPNPGDFRASRRAMQDDIELSPTSAKQISSAEEAAATDYPVREPPKAEATEAHTGYEWVHGVSICLSVTVVILVLNIILTIVAVVRAHHHSGNEGFVAATIYAGNCTRSRNSAIGLHLVINLLGTILLGASNYCMQCLSAPSRDEVDRAHGSRIWLDIGSPSVRNLRMVSWKRVILWMLLFASSIPIHFIYNSAIFSTLSSNAYGVTVVSSNFTAADLTHGSPSSGSCFEQLVGSSLPETQQAIDSGEFEVLNKKDCINKYAVQYLSNRRTLILVADNSTIPQQPGLWGSIGSPPVSIDAGVDDAFSWMCSTLSSYQDPSQQFACRKADVLAALGTWSVKAQNLTKTATVVAARDWSWAITKDNYTDLSNSQSLPSLLVENILTVGFILVSGTTSTLEDLKETLKNETYSDNPSFYKQITVYQTDSACGGPSASDTQNYAVDHCLSQKVEEHCQLMYSLPICLAVISCNIIKVICMFFTIQERRKNPLLTVGDAVASFLTHPDETTAGRCWMAKKTVTRGPQPWSIGRWRRNLPTLKVRMSMRGPLRKWRIGIIVCRPVRREALIPGDNECPNTLPDRKRWFQAVSTQRWVYLLLLFLASALGAISLLLTAISGLGELTPDTNLQGLWSLGFGTVRAETLIRYVSSGLIPMVLLSNAPQLILSLLYYLCNGALTCMLLAVEYGGYAVERKPLRVSWPQGGQRSTYFLSLPYKYSIPIMVVSGVLHWLVSLSVFYARIIQYDQTGVADAENIISTCGFSPMAMIFTIILGGLALLAIFILGFRTFQSNMPLAVNCSAAISAACHPPADDTGAALKPVMWGEVARPLSAKPCGPIEGIDTAGDLQMSDESGGSERGSDNHIAVSHCSFTSNKVTAPELMRLYA